MKNNHKEVSAINEKVGHFWTNLIERREYSTGGKIKMETTLSSVLAKSR